MVQIYLMAVLLTYLLSDATMKRTILNVSTNEIEIVEDLDKLYEPTVEEKITILKNSVQSKQDSEAVKKGYDNILSACSYAGFANPFQAEAQAFLIWRAGCWEKCYQIMAEVQGGTRPFPTVDELLAELPSLQLP